MSAGCTLKLESFGNNTLLVDLQLAYEGNDGPLLVRLNDDSMLKHVDGTPSSGRGTRVQHLQTPLRPRRPHPHRVRHPLGRPPPPETPAVAGPASGDPSVVTRSRHAYRRIWRHADRRSRAQSARSDRQRRRTPWRPVAGTQIGTHRALPTADSGRCDGPVLGCLPSPFSPRTRRSRRRPARATAPRGRAWGAA